MTGAEGRTEYESLLYPVLVPFALVFNAVWLVLWGRVAMEHADDRGNVVFFVGSVVVVVLGTIYGLLRVVWRLSVADGSVVARCILGSHRWQQDEVVWVQDTVSLSRRLNVGRGPGYSIFTAGRRDRAKVDALVAAIGASYRSAS